MIKSVKSFMMGAAMLMAMVAPSFAFSIPAPTNMTTADAISEMATLRIKEQICHQELDVDRYVELMIIAVFQENLRPSEVEETAMMTMAVVLMNFRNAEHACQAFMGQPTGN